MASHQIIALWVHPRSMSTAVERIMRERGDLTCFHEPFMYDYYLNRSPRSMPQFEPEEHQRQSYDETWRMILEAAKQGPVCFKDMSYYHLPQIYEDVELAKRLTNIFLIRDPRRAILSYHKLDAGVSSVEIGLEALWLHANWLDTVVGQTPIVVEAEAIQADPVGTVGGVWERIGLPDCPQAFAWRDGEIPEGWRSVTGWHKDVIDASGIRPPEEDGIAEKFSQAAAREPRLQQLLDQHLPFYNMLKSIA